MTETVKIVIPMAGLGTRLRPHTWSRPKPLLRIAGKTVLDYILDLFNTLPDPQNVELVFIIGYLGDQIQEYMQQNHPNMKAHYVVQPEMRGQSDAVYLAREHLQGPMIVAYADTILETNFNFLEQESYDAVAWVKPVPDPRRFGVAVANEQGRVTRLIEKPQEMDNNLAVVGFYYFRQAELLLSAIEEQFARGVTLKGEYFLADAINIVLERGLRMRTEQVDVWLDAGTPDALLDTNQYLLDHTRATPPDQIQGEGIAIIPPVYVHPQAEIRASVIGPYASLGAGCRVEGSIIRNSIIEEGAQVSDSILEDSLLGQNVRVNGKANHLNLGDQAWAMIK